jgi:hypothetical protein
LTNTGRAKIALPVLLISETQILTIAGVRIRIVLAERKEIIMKKLHSNLVILLLVLGVLMLNSCMLLRLGVDYDNQQGSDLQEEERKVTRDESEVPKDEHEVSEDESEVPEVVSEVQGQYSREAFSGNSYEFITFDGTVAVFTFNNDSSFVCSYDDGPTYKGKYEVYNGLYISVIKCNQLREDTSSNYDTQLLADEIENISIAMMERDILNTYLLWLEVDTMIEDGTESTVDLIQPFCVITTENIAVNIMAPEQGSFNLIETDD